MKLNNVFVVLFGVLPIWPQIQVSSQGTLDSIKEYRHELKVDSARAVNDSLRQVRDSLNDKVQSYAANFQNSANELPGKTAKLKKTVDGLKNKSIDTVSVTRIKYIPTLGPVDKSEYYLKQRAYADSLAKERKDSVDQAWRERSIFRKALGLKPRNKKK